MKLEKVDYKEWTFVSLGCDCEVDFRFRHYNKSIRSYIYSYTAVLDPNGFLNSLETFDLLPDGDFVPFKNGMLRHRQSGLCYHLKEMTSWPIVLTDSDEHVFRSRLRHLVEKTKALFDDASAKIVFVQKVPSFWMSNAYFESLLSVLKKVVKGRFVLAIVIANRYMNECKSILAQSDQILVQCVRHCSAPNKRGDIWRWLGICRRFSTGSTLRYFLSSSPLLRRILLPIALMLKRGVTTSL